MIVWVGWVCGGGVWRWGVWGGGGVGGGGVYVCVQLITRQKISKPVLRWSLWLKLYSIKPS